MNKATEEVMQECEHEPYYWDPAKKTEYDKVMRQRDIAVEILKYFFIILMASWIPFWLWVDRNVNSLYYR